MSIFSRHHKIRFAKDFQYILEIFVKLCLYGNVNRAKRIINHAVVNEDPNARIIRELRAEVDALKEMLKHATVRISYD